MRLLHIIRSANPETGGPIEALVRISEVLLNKGHSVEVLSLELEEVTSRYSIPFPITGLGPSVGRYGYNLRLVDWLKGNAHRFDTVILHGLWNYSSLGSWRALRHLAVPYFIFAHGMMDPWFRDAYPLKHFLKEMLWLLAEGRVLRDANAVLFTCDEEAIRARHVFAHHVYEERVVRLGTSDPSRNELTEKAAFLAAFPNLADKQFLLFLGRIHPKKGCDLLVRAFAEAIDMLPPHVDLVIAGPDQQGTMHSLHEIAVRMGAANRIHWLGMLTGALKWGFLRSASALILPSHQENFGMVVAEAMACSTPVLISSKVNIWREVIEAKAGLAEPDTLDGTRNLIRKFFALSKEEYAQMKNAARQGYLRYFDIEVTTGDLIDVMDAAQSGYGSLPSSR